MATSIPPSSLAAVNYLQTATNTSSTGSRNLSIGSYVQAQVLSSSTDNNSMPQSYKATVVVAGQTYQALSSSPLTPGQQVTLRVLTPTLLQAVPTTSPEQQLLQTQLKSYLPQQLNLSQLQPLLQNLALTPTALAVNPNLTQTLASLRQAFPSKEDLKQADTLRQAVQNSGFFTEKRLIQGKDVSSDQKVLLWQAMADLPEDHPMHKALEGRLARIQVMQLSNLQQDTQHVELAVNSNYQSLEPVNLAIKRDAPEKRHSSENDDNTTWQIEMDFEVSTGETIYMKLQWQQQLSIQLWLPDNAWMQDLDANNQQELISILGSKGVSVANYSQMLGKPVSNSAPEQYLKGMSLIDERA